MSKNQKTGSSSSDTTPLSDLRNPFQKTGCGKSFEVKETRKECVVRVDMPGSPESDLAFWVDANNVHVFADEPALEEYEHSGRKYGGSMHFNPETYDVEKAKAKLLNGVLWITVPKH